MGESRRGLDGAHCTGGEFPHPRSLLVQVSAADSVPSVSRVFRSGFADIDLSGEMLSLVLRSSLRREKDAASNCPIVRYRKCGECSTQDCLHSISEQMSG